MTQSEIFEAVKNNDAGTLSRLLGEGADVNQQDEHGWTPLAWAAGKGVPEIVELLLGHGADVSRTGKDNRTPLMIARAASHGEIARVLTEAEKVAGTWEDPAQDLLYCRGHYLRELRPFAGWSESRINWQEENCSEAAPLADDDVVYIHRDLTVTRSIWHGESVIFDRVTPEWREFCEETLQFAIPEDLL